MNQLKTIISKEYAMDIKSKSFWVSTFLVPLLLIGFGIFIGIMSEESEAMKEMSEATAPSQDLTGMQVLAMMMGIFLTFFIMIYGAQIFNKVKSEKTNRIVEIIVACVPGRTMMLAKVISVGLVGLTQLFIWGLLLFGLLFVVYIFLPVNIPFEELLDVRVLMTFIWGVLYFLGGYVFYGSLYAAVGALTDKNNENQGYVTLITFILMASFYIGIFSVDNLDSSLTIYCNYIPFTSPTIGAVSAISGGITWWEAMISLLILYVTAGIFLSLAGKIYTSALLLKGKKFSPKDIITFLKSK